MRKFKHVALKIQGALLCTLCRQVDSLSVRSHTSNKTDLYSLTALIAVLFLRGGHTLVHGSHYTAWVRIWFRACEKVASDLVLGGGFELEIHTVIADF